MARCHLVVNVSLVLGLVSSYHGKATRVMAKLWSLLQIMPFFQIHFLSQPRPTTLTYTSLTLYIGLTLLWMFALTPFWRRNFSFSGPSHLDSAAQCKAVLWSWIRIKQNSNQIETDLITEGSLHLVKAEHQLVGGIQNRNEGDRLRTPSLTPFTHHRKTGNQSRTIRFRDYFWLPDLSWFCLII